ncbi:hypothetical protein A3H10_00740 [Candidatus Uhrbacteria bacterium RIFCSPLOWO2_12_FULL_46_10]|nr:MAG: hypothetical protein A2752_02320 [Candidatus Uhrbacteria bacterium RIFCSPHIGHO2_01_FULL_46_23]OGL68123.1 MAG: hypothetical protein A3D60_03915 [Candidatus Uhrbacteria bacterium RIFCSPHIGHO2_02_FULL_47_29]OGL74833.1 MAG: hypothetical protein A3E96_04775 [Candidatus Uhrbacteria bacterium RIFCSPHIGHO2_12_FULL_46_13]OGL90204.1 MAG: hypothetical protein A3H10_00740 [Candidatus Uhrbacteria bacterium RIFCSPLOWO2_12_FULL_46_10]
MALTDPQRRKIDGIILAAVHKQFKEMQLLDFVKYFNGSGRGVLVDIKSQFLSSAPENLPIIYKCL